MRTSTNQPTSTLSANSHRYRSVETEVIAVCDDVIVLRRAYDDACVRAPAACVRLLHACGAFRTLDEHAERIAGETASPDFRETVLGELQRAVTLGLLIPLNELRQRCAERGSTASSPASISAVGIPTRNRPDLALRCVRGVVDHARRHHRKLEIVIMDDSDDDALRSKLGEIDVPTGVTLRYASRNTRRHYADSLSMVSGVPREVCAFALLNPCDLGTSLGANRNCLALDLAGSTILTIDDDIVCRAGRAPWYADGIALQSRPDPTEFEMHRDHASAVGSVRWMQEDFFREHERWLGATLGYRLAVDVDGIHAEEIDESLVTGVVRYGASTPVTMTGVAGDSGTNIPYQFVAAAGPSHDAVVADERAYELARTSRILVRAATRVTLSNYPFLMPTGTGMDLRKLLPPFPPVLRRSDAAFAYLLYLACPHHYIAHLPLVMEHDPAPGRAALEPGTPLRPGRPFFSELVCHAASTAQGPLARMSHDPAERIAVIGEQTQRVASLPPEEFEAFLRKRILERMSSTSREVEALLNRFPDAPEYWIRDMRRTIDDLADRARSEDFHAPFDVPAVVDKDNGLQRAGDLLERFGTVLKHWPAMVEAATALGERGMRVSEPVR